MNENEIYSFQPIIDKQSTILILGSIPGVKSLEANEYYGNPRNHFWKIIYTLLNKELEQNYSQKVALLKRNGIALWDVISTCHRQGSLDTNIKAEKANDFHSLLKIYPGIKFIGFNGTKAFNTYKKMIGLQSLNKINYALLPSTSPIPGKNRKSFEDKLQVCAILLDYLKI